MKKKKKKIDNEKICKNTTELLNNIIKIKNENENNIKKCNNYIKILQKFYIKNVIMIHIEILVLQALVKDQLKNVKNVI